VNSFIMQQNIPNAQLIIYPDSITARTTSTRSSSLNHATLFFERVTTAARLLGNSRSLILIFEEN